MIEGNTQDERVRIQHGEGVNRIVMAFFIFYSQTKHPNILCSCVRIEQRQQK